MNKLISICMNYSGMRDNLTDAEELTVLDLINTEFNTLKPYQVAAAFRMNASGKYWKAVIAYQTFSPIFVGEVLGNYKEWLRKGNLKPKPIAVTHQIENKVDPVFEQKRAFEFIERVINEEGTPPKIGNYSEAFKHCERNDFIKITTKEKKELFKKVELKAKLNVNDRRAKGENVAALITQSLNPKSIALECQKQLVIDYINKK